MSGSLKKVTAENETVSYGNMHRSARCDLIQL